MTHDKRISVLAAACVIMGTGCASTIQHRGWVGGSLSEAYKSSHPTFAAGGNIPALAEEVANKQKRAVFVSRIRPATPVAQAGLREGDLIIKVNGGVVGNRKDFCKLVQKSAPGRQLKLDVYRDGQIIDKAIVVGKETYRKGGHVAVGLQLSPTLEIGLIPPRFSILGILSFERDRFEPDLHSPEWQYFKTIESQSSRSTYLTPQGEPYAPGRGWRTWLGVVGFGLEERILRQDGGSNDEI